MVKNTIFKFLVCFFFSFASQSYAKNLEMSLPEYNKAIEQADFSQRLKNYSNLVVKFSQGDVVHLKIDSDLFKSAEKNEGALEMKKTFYLMMPIGNGDIKISQDNKTYFKIQKAFNGTMGLMHEKETQDLLILSTTLRLKESFRKLQQVDD